MNRKQVVTVASYIFAGALIVFGLIFTDFSIEIITFAIVIGVFIIINAVRSSKQKSLNIIEYDELSILIALKSYRNSWLVTVAVIFIFCWINFLGGWKPSFDVFITYLLIGMMLSFHISRFAYLRKLKAE